MIANETRHDIPCAPDSSYRRTNVTPECLNPGPVSRIRFAFPERPLWIPAFAGMTIRLLCHGIEEQAQVWLSLMGNQVVQLPPFAPAAGALADVSCQRETGRRGRQDVAWRALAVADRNPCMRLRLSSWSESIGSCPPISSLFAQRQAQLSMGRQRSCPIPVPGAHLIVDQRKE